jgi:hypothetical protein
MSMTVNHIDNKLKYKDNNIVYLVEFRYVRAKELQPELPYRQGS